MNDRPEQRDGGARAERKQRRKERRRRRILKSTAVLPGLATLLNALSGFAAMHFATADVLGEAKPENLIVAAWLIFVAMGFDMLDGRLARMTRRTSDFGGQLDSLADVISFGAAPAMLMLRTVTTALRGQMHGLWSIPPEIAERGLERAAWCVAAIYLACAALRLARFNVENEPDEASHMDFRGLPSPAAAAVVASLVLLFENLTLIDEGWRSSHALLITVGVSLPIAALIGGLLMVSRFRYPHVVNRYVRGRRPLNHLLKLVIIVLAVALTQYLAIAALAVAFALSGPVGAARRVLRHRRRLKAEE